MPTLPKYRKIKRPTVVIKKKGLKRRPYDKKSTNSSLEKLKNNNIALARALNKQKQETQYLYRQTIDLTAQNQDLQCLKKRHLAAFSGILKNSKEAMELMVQATQKVIYVISACNELSNTESSTAPRITVTPNKRDSTKRMSPNKSPARGVVQPMVSGHAIAQPAITLSRIRIAVAPNVSDIEESTESSPTTSAPRNHQRLSPARSTRPLNRSITPLMPQRIRISSPRAEDESRASDETRRLSNRHSNRYEKRKSRNSTRHSSEQTSPNSINNIDATIRSPRVSLEDVSKLMQNSQSINVRNLMEVTNEEAPIDESPESRPTPLSRISSPSYKFDPRPPKNRKKEKEAKEKTQAKLVETQSRDMMALRSYEDDPLEGTSWSHNNYSETSLAQVPANESLSEINRSCLETCIRSRESLSATNRMSLTMINHQDGYGYGDVDDDNDDDDEMCRVITSPPRNDDDDKTTFTTLISRNVCTGRRGCSREPDDFDPDDFTMMPGIKKQPVPWTMADLQIPCLEPHILEDPLPRLEFSPEPEITETIRINSAIPHQLRQSVDSDLLPNVTVNANVTIPSIDTAGRESDDETTMILPAGRRRIKKQALESSSESDSSSPPQMNNVSMRRRTDKKRDPKSAKVVLEKLKEPNGRKRDSSPDSRRSGLDSYMHRTSGSLFPAPNSDSESSNASVGSRQSSGRPKRQKAPVYLGEPSIIKKLRR